MGTKCLCGFRASGDKRTQHLAIPNQALDVRRLDHLQKFVGRIAGEAADSSGCVKKTDTHAEAVVYNQVELETSGAFIHKIILVLIKDKSLNPPVVVDKLAVGNCREKARGCPHAQKASMDVAQRAVLFQVSSSSEKFLAM